jgi:cold shock CspA family protein
MGRSQDSFNKKEREKKKLKKRQDKEEKKEERKANAKKGKSLEEMMGYLDENGNITSVPPDPSKKREINAEDIQIGVPKQEDREEETTVRKGIVAFFNEDKGFGFIRDLETQERIFVHVNQLSVRIKENDKVTFEVERGPKGLNAVRVELVKS